MTDHVNSRRRAAALLSATVLISTLGLASPSASANSGEKYVALGDSFAAGPLILNQVALDPCFRSDRNYPHVAAGLIGVERFTDVSCSSAQTIHMTQPQPGSLPISPANPPQFESLTDDTTLVTITIGANDIELVGLALGCINALPPPFGVSCKAKNTVGGVDVYAQRIDALAPTIDGVLDGIRSRSPNAKVVVVGYGHYVKPGGCYPLLPMWPQDADWVEGLKNRLNDVLAMEAEHNGYVYVDTNTPGIGHGVCELPGVKWIEGLVSTSDAAPVHPNALGMSNFGALVAEAVG